MSQAVISQRAKQAYQTAQIEAQDPIGLIVKLYDGVLGFLNRGATALDVGDRAGASDPIRRATDIVGELQAVLDLERGGEIAANLDRIYSYCRAKIMDSHVQGKPDGLVEVRRLLEPLRDAWDEARSKQLVAGAR